MLTLSNLGELITPARRIRSEKGQALVIMVVSITALLAVTTLVLDVGSWFRSHRGLQASVDAAALAGAQALPYDPSSATALAIQYASSNGDSLDVSGVTFSSALVANDTITVQVSKPAPGFFSKIFGINSVTVHAQAAARSGSIASALYVAPIAVNQAHPLLSGGGCPCFDAPTTLPLGPAGAPGAFQLVNLDGSGGTVGASALASWITNGFDQYLPLGSYLSDPGAKWNSSPIQSALDSRIGTDLLFPIYDTLSGNGANATYHVIGWVGFHLTGVTARGNQGSLSGWFTQVIWSGIQATSGGTPDFGARTIALVQ